MKLKFPHLGNRLLTALGGREPASEAHSDRLREVLGRDRALAVGVRAHARTPALGSRGQPPALTVVGPPAVQLVTPPVTAEAGAPAAPSSPPAEPAPTASAASDERPQRVQHEPIRTRTMARLLAAQGYRQRALAIYEELLSQPGADAALRAEAEALRARPA